VSIVEHGLVNELTSDCALINELENIPLDNVATSVTESPFNFDICELSWDALSKINAFPVTVK
jgi:hypothetical protein